MPTKAEAVRYVSDAIRDDLPILFDDGSVGPRHFAGIAPKEYALYVDRGVHRGMREFKSPDKAADAFVERVGAAEAVSATKRAYERHVGKAPTVRGASLADAPIHDGVRVLVTKGSTAIGIAKGVTLRVESVRLETGNSAAVKVLVMNGAKSGSHVSLRAIHVNRLSDDEVSLLNWHGDKIKVRVR